MFCTKCGTGLLGSANFCNNCGNPVRKPQMQSSAHIGNIHATRKTSKAVYVAMLAVILIVGGFFAVPMVLSLIGGSSDLDARLMSVFRVDGDDVNLQNAGGATTNARAGMGLHAGYAVSTGLGTFCYISLDTDSLVKMDVSTDISVSQLTDNLLRMNINSGQVLLDVQNQAPGHELEAIIGNTVITVRGTLFVMGQYAGGEAIVIMLDGGAYVNGVQLETGYTIRVYDGFIMDYDVSPTVFGNLDEFQLNAIVDNRGRLLASGAINFEDLELIEALLHGLSQDDEDMILHAEAPTPEPTQTPAPTPTPTPEPTPFATRTATVQGATLHVRSFCADLGMSMGPTFVNGTRVVVYDQSRIQNIRVYRASGVDINGNHVVTYFSSLQLVFD